MAIPTEAPRSWRALTERGRQKAAIATLGKGTEVVCPGCNALICTAADDIRPGMGLDTWRFVFAQDGHEPGVPLACRACGVAFHDDRTGKLHTRNGWA